MRGVSALTQPFGSALGYQFPFVGTSPAAGASFSLTINGEFVHRLLALVFTLTTDANAANRYVTVECRGKDGLAFSVSSPAAAVSANSTQRFAASAWKAVPAFDSTTDLFFPLDAVFLYPGDVLAIVVASVQAGDTLTAIRGVEERFPLDPSLLPVRSPE